MQFGINKHKWIFPRPTKVHEPVGRLHFVVFEKFTSAYLFQIAREKSCDYLLIMYLKKWGMFKQKKRTLITQSRKNWTINCAIGGTCLIWKQKISLVLTKSYCSLANHNPEFQCVICIGITLFALVLITHFALMLHILHSFLSQSELSNFFVYIMWVKNNRSMPVGVVFL